MHIQGQLLGIYKASNIDVQSVFCSQSGLQSIADYTDSKVVLVTEICACNLGILEDKR